MKAWLVHRRADGGAPDLVFSDVAEPVPGPGELLVRVRAVGLNRADLSRKAGHYERVPTRPADPIAGLEAAGEVVALGAGVEGFAVGDRVMGMPSGAYAERALLHARLAMRVPDGLSDTEAAALPVALLTAHDALVAAGRFVAGDAVVVQGATSGVGLAAVQIASWLRASAVIGVGRARGRLEKLRPLGLTHAVEASDDLADAVRRATGGRGADVVLDLVGASSVAATLDACALAGRWVQIGRMGGGRADVDLDLVSRKRLSLVGVTFRTRSLDDFATVVERAVQQLGGALASRAVAMPVVRTYPLDGALAAQQAMRTEGLVGKLVLTV